MSIKGGVVFVTLICYQWCQIFGKDLLSVCLDAMLPVREKIYKPTIPVGVYQVSIKNYVFVNLLEMLEEGVRRKEKALEAK